MTGPLLSIVIIGRNEGDRLVRCIQSVQAMDFPEDFREIIYVDSASTDNSLNRALEEGVDMAISLDAEYPTAALGRNRGLEEATGKHVLFLDGDTQLNPDFVQVAIDELERDGKTAVVFGHRVEMDQHSMYTKICDFDWDRSSGLSVTAAGDILARTDVMKELDGYDGSMIAGEDPEMANRVINAGYRIRHIDHEMVKHDLAIHSFRQYCKHAIRSGYAYSAVAAKTKDRAIPLWTREARKNWIQGIAYCMVPVAIVCAALSPTRFYSLPIIAAASALVLVRTFMKNRSKIDHPWVRFIYAIHTHFVKIPILFGQFQFVFKKRRQLIEYK